MVRWMRWHCPPDTGSEIQTLVVWCRASYRGSPQYWIFTSEQGRNILFLWDLNAGAGFEPSISDFSSRLLQGPRPRHWVTPPWFSSYSKRLVRDDVIKGMYCTYKLNTQQTRYGIPMMASRWASVADEGPTMVKLARDRQLLCLQKSVFR